MVRILNLFTAKS